MTISHQAAPAQGALTESTYRRLLDASSTSLFALVALDGRIAYVNGASRRLLGYEPHELIGRHGSRLISPGLAADATAIFERASAGRPQVGRRTLIRHNDGFHVCLRFDATPVRDDEGQVEWVAFSAHEEPGERTSSAPRPAWSLEELIERLPAAVYVAEPGPRGRWRYVSPQIEEMLGFAPDDWLSDSGLWARQVHPDDRDRVVEEEARDTAGGSASVSEYRMLTRTGELVWVRDEAMLRSDELGRPLYDGLLIEITDRKRFENRLQFLADHDPLTGLANRRSFLASLERELQRGRRTGEQATVLMLDLDNLKAVNDSYGHSAGDELIRTAAEVLGERLRDSDTVGRLGGDEFAVLLRGATSERGARVARELIEEISARTREATGGLAGASAGVAPLRHRFATPSSVLAIADEAMYRAKRAGGGRVEIAIAAE